MEQIIYMSSCAAAGKGETMSETKRRNYNGLIFWVVKRELRGSGFACLRAIAYYLPVLLIFLVLLVSGAIRFDNQQTFLRGMEYAAIRITEEENLKDDAGAADFADFQVFDGTAAAAENRRELLLYKYQYQTQIFRPRRVDVNYAAGYFNALSSVDQQTNTLQLRDDEAAVSYDTAQALHLKTGDEMLLVSADSASYIPVTIREIFPTKYKAGEIGETGTVLLGNGFWDTDSEGTAFFDGSTYWTFLRENEGVQVNGTIPEQDLPEAGAADRMADSELLSLDMELTEAEPGKALLKAGAEEGITPSLLFPVLGLLLLIRIVIRELSQRFARKEYVMAVWTAQGTGIGFWRRIFFLAELTLLSISSFAALVLYKYLFIQMLVGEYMRWELLLQLWCIMTAGAIPLILIILYGQRSKWEQWDLAGLLAGDTQ